MKNYISNQSGRSMIEMLGVLAIVGVLSVAGIAGYSKAMAKYKTNKLIDQLSTVTSNVRTTFAGQGNYKGLSLETGYQLGVFPEEMVKDCDLDGYKYGCVKNAMGGIVFLISYQNRPDQFYMTFYNLSKDACSSIVTADWGGASTFDYFFHLKTGNTYSAKDIQERAASIAAALCDCKASENNCQIDVTFK